MTIVRGRLEVDIQHQTYGIEQVMFGISHLVIVQVENLCRSLQQITQKERHRHVHQIWQIPITTHTNRIQE